MASGPENADAQRRKPRDLPSPVNFVAAKRATRAYT
jgi:hypothetical protein